MIHAFPSRKLPFSWNCVRTCLLQKCIWTKSENNHFFCMPKSIRPSAKHFTSHCAHLRGFVFQKMIRRHLKSVSSFIDRVRKTSKIPHPNRSSAPMFSASTDIRPKKRPFAVPRRSSCHAILFFDKNTAISHSIPLNHLFRQQGIPYSQKLRRMMKSQT